MPRGRFPASFVHQVFIITGLNKLLYVLALKGVKLSLELNYSFILYVHPINSFIKSDLPVFSKVGPVSH